jgi:hypothetical protein
MTKDQNDQLARIATALGFTVVSRSPARYGNDWGRLELLPPNSGEEFSWNPLTHAGDRYELIQKLGMAVDFSGKKAIAKMRSPDNTQWLSTSFAKNELAESTAIVGLAEQWAQAVLLAKETLSAAPN